MLLYLSSYKIGKEPQQLLDLFQHGKTIAYIPNALDFTTADPERRKKHVSADIETMRELGFEIEELDLKGFFGKQQLLHEKIKQLNGLWVSGGNVFVLLQAMRLSGLDKILKQLSQQSNTFVYAGYSAAGCALAPDTRCYANVDDANDFPYGNPRETDWTGLGILNFAFMPHYDSAHAESAAVDKEIKFCIDNKILFKALKDGEAFVVDTLRSR